MSDEEDFFEFGAVVPYSFEPEYTEEELANHARESQVNTQRKSWLTMEERVK